MSTWVAAGVFPVAVAVSLAAAWLLVSRIERVGARLGVSEAMLGLLAALAADGPEITSAISALASHQGAVSAGVVLGSNVFNLAALLGLGALVAGRIALHRRPVLFEGAVAVWIAAACTLTAIGVLNPGEGLVLALVVLVPYIAVSAVRHERLGRRTGALASVARWLHGTLTEEEQELLQAIRPRLGGAVDVGVAVVALVVVIVSSVAMEHSATRLGAWIGAPQIVVGAIVLAAATSLPNAVAGIYLARRGRGSASLSTALNSNAFNVVGGFLLPAVVLGATRPSAEVSTVAGWYLGATVVVLLFAFRDRGLRRAVGALVVGGYAVFAVTVIVTGSLENPSGAWYVAPPVAVGVAALGVWLATSRRGRAAVGSG